MVYKIDNKETDELALIIGHLYGDGGITNKGRVHYCNSEDFLIKEFVSSMNKIFKIKSWIKRESNITRVRYPVNVGRILWHAFGKFSSGKDTKILTSEIQKMPLKWKAIMLRAWFNDDGSVVNTSQNYKVIAIHQKLEPLIIFIRDTLKEFEINSQIMKDNNEWLLRICGYTNLIKFRDKINFSSDYRKNKKLDTIIESINKPHFIIKNKILELLKEAPKTRKEITKLLGLNSGVVYGHLHGWKRKKRKSNLGLIDLGLVRFKKAGRINVYVKNKNK